MSENTLSHGFVSEGGNSMATDSLNANEGVSAGSDGTIHLILQGKGGVGKSVIASWLAEFLISRGRQVRCVDGDPGDRSVIVWLNEFFGPVTHGGKRFEEMRVYSDNRDKVLASVALPQRSPDTYGRTIRTMREKKMTFEEAINSPEFMLAQRSRLHL